MPRHFFKRIIRQNRDLGERWYLRPVRALLRDPALWASHRRSVVKAMTVGLFIGFLPIPGHVVLAVLVAVYRRINIGVAAAATFVSNPITFGPIVFAEYKLGSWLLGAPPSNLPFDMSLRNLAGELARVGPPLLLGGLLLAVVAALVGYHSLNAVWRWSASRRYRDRRRPRKLR